MPDFTERDALYADAVNRAALALGGMTLPESYIRAVHAGVDATLATVEARQTLLDAADEIDAQNPARPAERNYPLGDDAPEQEGDTLEGLIRAMVPIKHEPLATNVVNEWLERIRAVLDEEVIWEYAIEMPQRTSRDRLRRTTADYDLEGTKKRLKDYLIFAPDAYIVRHRAVDDWEPLP